MTGYRVRYVTQVTSALGRGIPAVAENTKGTLTHVHR